MSLSLRTLSLVTVRPKLLLRRLPQALPIFRKVPEAALLPVELWDVILSELTNDGLLLAACVCRTWNELALALYMRRHNIAAASSSMRIPAFVLQPLHISCVVPQIHTLHCTFPAYALLRRMKSLRAVVAKCPQLINLSVDWGYDPFKARTYLPSPPAALVAILRDVLRVLAARTAGPVIVVGNETIQKFAPEDIGRWPIIASAESRVSAPVHGNTWKSFWITGSVDAIDVRSIKVGSGPLDCFTQITFPTRTLTLRPTDDLSLVDAATILSHIYISTVMFLDIETNSIDPVALSKFRDNHPLVKIREFEHLPDPASAPAV
ncbi:hypothetical protein K438DRAFT_1804935 [Mycena galopus ATCC 62051]|nr:hypothetical protein K438DRAFT_1804935 [Mycena galopus ATCC 62051]